MRTLILTIILGVAAIPFIVGCSKAGDPVISFAVSAATVAEGDDVPVSVSVRNASADDRFTFSSEIDEYDALEGIKTPTGARLVLRNGNPVRDGDVLSFPADGHCDLWIKGLPAGTYSVSVTLSHEGLMATEGAVIVVTRKSVHGGDDTPSDRVLVSDFTVPAPGLNGTFDDEGNLIVPLDVYSSAEPFRHDCVIMPSNAENATLKAVSDNPRVAAARIHAPSRLSVIPLSPGKATVTVSTLDGTVVKTVPVVVPERQGGQGVTDFDLPPMDPGQKRIEMPYNGGGYSWVPSVEPSTARGDFIVVSSDPAVVTGSYDPGEGRIIVNPHMPGYADLRIIADGGLGISKILPVTVYGDFAITVSCVESTPTPLQEQTHTFPCVLLISCPTDIEFPSPVRFTFTMTATVAADNRDMRQVMDREDIDFFGNRAQGYDMTGRVLIPAYQIYEIRDFVVRINGKMLHDTVLDPKIWRITVNETWRNSGSRLSGILLNN